MDTTLVRVRIQPEDTLETLKEKAKIIARTYIKKTLIGLSLVEIVEPEYIVFKIFY